MSALLRSATVISLLIGMVFEQIIASMCPRDV